MTAFEPVLLRNRGVENSTALSVYESRGGYTAARKALKMTPVEIKRVVLTRTP
jgi:NADH-quinone oxidoreductase subunit F